MELTKEQQEQVINFGAFGYKAEKAATILEISEDQFKKDKEIQRLYKKGEYMAEYVLDLKLFNLAQNGDMKAFEKFEIRKAQR